MSIFDGKRLPSSVFKLDVERMRRGWYSDKYFYNIVALLSELAKNRYRFEGISPDLSEKGLSLADVDVGNIEVEMQWFTRRHPYSVVVGVDKALAMIRECTGYFDGKGSFVNTFDSLEVLAVHDGFIAPYDGDPMNVCPVMKVRGIYRHFAMLETPTVGTLSRATRVATNVYEVVKSARGKHVLFFPARFDAHEVQAADGYAYQIAVALYNVKHGKALSAFVSTDAQGDWWGGAGGGTVAHAVIACFLADTSEAMMAFARIIPGEIPRIALVDFKNDCIGDSLAVMKRMCLEYLKLLKEGNLKEAEKFILFGVRPDTSSEIKDVSIAPLGDKKLDCGVNPRLVFAMREAIDKAYLLWGLEGEDEDRARKYCKEVKIAVTGGFTPKRIRQFEELGVPADVYGVGSYLLSSCDTCGTNNDFTADVVKVKIKGKWYDMAKIGRRSCENPDLQPVR